MANSQHMMLLGAPIPPLAMGREGEPVASTVPSLHPLLIPSPEAHWRSDVTSKRMLPTVPVSPCRMTSDSWSTASLRRRRPAASVTFKNPMSTRSTRNNCRTKSSNYNWLYWHTGNYQGDEGGGGDGCDDHGECTP